MLDGVMILYCFLLLFTVVVTGLTLRWTGGKYDCVAEGNALSAAHSDLSVYRSQMAEIENEKKQGLLDGESADEARLELARRMLAAERKAVGRNVAGNRRNFAFRLFLSMAVVFIPLFSWGVYALTGSPDMPSHPFPLFLEREPATLNAAEKLVRAEVIANRNPQDGHFIDELADLYLDAGRFQDAVNTYNRAIAMNGENAERLLRYAIALTGFEQGVVSQQAEEAFLKVAELDPQNPEARIFLARGLIQNGKEAEAIKLLEDFLKTAPENAAWRQNLGDIVAELKRQMPDKKSHDENTGITTGQWQFVAANVGKLVARLEREPDDLQGWMMLITAWLVIGRHDEAEASLKKGLRLLSADKAEKLVSFAREKGLDGEGG